MNDKLASIKNRFTGGRIRNQDLEGVVFKEVYGSDILKLRDACRDASIIRCEDIEEKSGVSLNLIKHSQIDNCSLIGSDKILSGIEMKVAIYDLTFTPKAAAFLFISSISFKDSCTLMFMFFLL